MKRLLLSAIIAMGIHAYLLWADFGRIGEQPSLKPKPQTVTLTLVSRPVPKVEPVTKPSKPAPPPVPEPAPETIPKSKPEPKPKSEPKPDPKLQPEPVRTRMPDIMTAPPSPERQTPSRFIPESEPVPYSRTEPITGEEKADTPASLPETEPRPRTGKTDEQEQTGSGRSVEATPTPAHIREAKPKYRDNPSPLYPIMARKRGYQGTVILDVFIDKNGRVADTQVFSSSGYRILDKAARVTVANWLFEPGMKGEEKIDMWVKIPIRFQIK